MNEPINCSLPIYFYDDRNKYDSMMKLTQVLYQDEDTCVCIANWTAPHIAEYTTKLMFNIADGQVINSDYNSWIATNDVAWAEEEDARIQLRSARGMTNEEKEQWLSLTLVRHNINREDVIACNIVQLSATTYRMTIIKNGGPLTVELDTARTAN